MITSELRTVERRWAITKAVRPFIRASIPRCTIASVRVSMELVASSKIIAGGSATAARAIEISWRCPWERLGAIAREHGVVAFRQAGDEVVRAGELGCGDAFRVACVEVAVADVVHHSAGEQVHVLQHYAQASAQVGLADLVDVDAVVADLAVGDVVEAVDEVGDGRFACTGGAHEGDLLTGFGKDAHVMQHLVVGRVAKVNVVHANVAAQFRRT